MIRLLLLVLPGVALGHPVDAWLRAHAEASTVVVVPRIGALVDPLAQTLSRAKALPQLAQILPTADAVGRLDPAWHRQHGLDLEGPLLYADGPLGPALSLPLRADADPRVYLEQALGLETAPITVAGHPAWRTADGVALGRGRALLAAQAEGSLIPLLQPADGSSFPLEKCGHGPGEADLYAITRVAPYFACTTLRLDGDRAELIIKLAPHPIPEAWFGAGDGSLLAHLGAEVTGVFAVHTTAFALQRWQTLTAHPVGAALTRQLDGRMVVGVGPTLGRLTLLLGVRDGAAVAKTLAEALPGLPKVTVTALDARTWRLALPQNAAPAGMPAVEEAYVAVRADRLILTTRREALDAAGDPRPKLLGAHRPAPAHLEAPIMSWVNVVGGRPHDGRAYLDGLRALIGDDETTAGPLTAAAAWLLSHVGQWAVSLSRQGRTLTLHAEVLLL